MHSFALHKQTNKVNKLEELARERFGCTVGQLALAWCVKNKHVSTVLLGATKPEQLTENLGAIAVAEKLTAKDLLDIDEILVNKPEVYGGFGGNPQWRSVDDL
jgi:aryl-alcohol dehydrogenase-like predicted oxidoreductase